MSLVFAHPVYGKTLNLLEKTAGRDKLMRLVQYWARFLSYILYRRGYSTDTIRLWKTLQAQLALSRKLFRVAKPLGFANNAYGVYQHKTSDAVLRLTGIWRNIFQGCYLFLDSFVWIHKAGVKSYSKAKFDKLQRVSYQFWFAALSVGIANSLYQLYQVREAEAQMKLESATNKDVNKEKQTHSTAPLLKAKEKALHRKLLWDVLDLTIPASALNYVSGLDDGLVGLAGLITSAFGLEELWAKC